MSDNEERARQIVHEFAYSIPRRCTCLSTSCVDRGSLEHAIATALDRDEADARLGRIVRESGATADDCLDIAVTIMNIDTPVAGMLRAIAAIKRGGAS